MVCLYDLLDTGSGDLVAEVTVWGEAAEEMSEVTNITEPVQCGSLQAGVVGGAPRALCLECWLGTWLGLSPSSTAGLESGLHFNSFIHPLPARPAR